MSVSLNGKPPSTNKTPDLEVFVYYDVRRNAWVFVPLDDEPNIISELPADAPPSDIEGRCLLLDWRLLEPVFDEADVSEEEARNAVFAVKKDSEKLRDICEDVAVLENSIKALKARQLEELSELQALKDRQVERTSFLTEQHEKEKVSWKAELAKLSMKLEATREMNSPKLCEKLEAETARANRIQAEMEQEHLQRQRVIEECARRYKETMLVRSEVNRRHEEVCQARAQVNAAYRQLLQQRAVISAEETCQSQISVDIQSFREAQAEFERCRARDQDALTKAQQEFDQYRMKVEQDAAKDAEECVRVAAEHHRCTEEMCEDRAMLEADKKRMGTEAERLAQEQSELHLRQTEDRALQMRHLEHSHVELEEAKQAMASLELQRSRHVEQVEQDHQALSGELEQINEEKGALMEEEEGNAVARMQLATALTEFEEAERRQQVNNSTLLHCPEKNYEEAEARAERTEEELSQLMKEWARNDLESQQATEKLKAEADEVQAMRAQLEDERRINCAQLNQLAAAKDDLEVQLQNMRTEHEAQMEEERAAIREDIARRHFAMRLEVKHQSEVSMRNCKAEAEQDAQKIREQAEKDVSEMLDQIANQEEAANNLQISLEEREATFQEKCRRWDKEVKKGESQMPQRFLKMAVEGFNEGLHLPELPSEDQHLLEDGKMTPEAVFTTTMEDLQGFINSDRDAILNRKRASERDGHGPPPPSGRGAAHGVVRTLVALHAWASVLKPPCANRLQKGDSCLQQSVEQLAVKIKEADKVASEQNVYLRHTLLSVCIGLFMRSAALKRVSRRFKDLSVSIDSLKKKNEEIAELDKLCWESLQVWSLFESSLKTQRRYIKFCKHNNPAHSDLRLLLYASADQEHEDAAFFLELANTVWQAENKELSPVGQQVGAKKHRKAPVL